MAQLTSDRADNVRNIEGGRITGADVTVKAKTVLEVIGASIETTHKLDLRGDRDLFLKVEG